MTKNNEKEVFESIKHNDENFGIVVTSVITTRMPDIKPNNVMKIDDEMGERTIEMPTGMFRQDIEPEIIADTFSITVTDHRPNKDNEPKQLVLSREAALQLFSMLQRMNIHTDRMLLARPY